jgi:uncharacterized protein YndB with AHSA1/START domain
MQKEITQTWFFQQSPEEVWDYLTKPELLKIWLMETDFKPVVGHKFRFICSATNFCEVLEVTPFTRLSYSWRTDSAVAGNTVDSIVLWTLLPRDNGTELHLLHDGFTVLKDYEGHNIGWTTCLKKLDAVFKNQLTDATTNP